MWPKFSYVHLIHINVLYLIFICAAAAIVRRYACVRVVSFNSLVLFTIQDFLRYSIAQFVCRAKTKFQWVFVFYIFFLLFGVLCVSVWMCFSSFDRGKMKMEERERKEKNAIDKCIHIDCVPNYITIRLFVHHAHQRQKWYEMVLNFVISEWRCVCRINPRHTPITNGLCFSTQRLQWANGCQCAPIEMRFVVPSPTKCWILLCTFKVLRHD